MARRSAFNNSQTRSKQIVKDGQNVDTEEEKATSADYKAPVDASKKGHSGEKVMTGPRGVKYYINRNGNKTYLTNYNRLS